MLLLLLRRGCCCRSADGGGGGLGQPFFYLYLNPNVYFNFKDFKPKRKSIKIISRRVQIRCVSRKELGKAGRTARRRHHPNIIDDHNLLQLSSSLLDANGSQNLCTLRVHKRSHPRGSFRRECGRNNNAQSRTQKYASQDRRPTIFLPKG